MVLELSRLNPFMMDTSAYCDWRMSYISCQIPTTFSHLDIGMHQEDIMQEGEELLLSTQKMEDPSLMARRSQTIYIE